MGLLDKAKAELNNYIQFDIFVFYLAYFTDETLSDVTDWLSYHQDIITEKLSEYDVYDDYRVEDNFDYNNSYFLNAISKLVKWGFFDDEFDKFDGEIDRDELFDFYYDIRELNEFSIFKELDINFYNALDLKFIVTKNTDKVTVSDKSPYRKINGVEIVSRVRYVFDGLQSKTSQSEVNPSAINENIQLGVSKYLDHIYQKAQNYHEQYFDENKDTLQTQLDQAYARITELEKVVEQSRATVTPIFDSQDSYTYPPELDVAIKIWLEIYQTDNIPKHLTNHSDKFTQACKNLGFSFTENAVKTRLKKVTTPQSQKEKTKNKNSLK